MPIDFGIGYSKNTNPEKAFTEALYASRLGLENNESDLSFVLATDHYHPDKFAGYLDSLCDAQTKVIGCSTAGIILKDEIITQGIAVLSIQSKDIHYGMSYVKNFDKDKVKDAGNLLASQCLTNYDIKTRNVFLSIVDGNIANTSPLLQGAQEVFGNIFPIVGGGSSDDFRFKPTFQFVNREILTRSAIGLLLGGNMQVGVGAGHGWRPLGKPRTVTSVEQNIIKTIDHRKASQIYIDYFGEDANHLYEGQLGQASILYPLGIFVKKTNEYLIRKVVDIHPDGAIVCQGDIPLGGEIHVMIGNKEACKTAVTEAATEAKNNMRGRKAQFVFVIESMARLKLFGRKAIEEIALINEVFDPQTPLFGLYSNGEICPMQTTKNIKEPFLQNQSIMVMAIGE